MDSWLNNIYNKCTKERPNLFEILKSFEFTEQEVKDMMDRMVERGDNE
jgi:ABC-type proline/glycine betaine transport system substrate-binding protein